MDKHTAHKALLAPLRAAMYDFEESSVRRALADVADLNAVFRLGRPIGDNTGADSYYENAFADLLKAWPDLERRDYIVIAGPDDHGHDWVGCGGYYTGVFTGSWLGIPPTGHQVSMRFHEFYRIENGKVVEMQALWDIPEVMMQARAWPLAPSLGLEWRVPGPATRDGLVPGPYDAERSQASCQHVLDMVEYLVRYPSQGGPQVMEMDRFWHPRMNWYGPAGIGTGRGVAGFRNWHQIPFLNGMPDRGADNTGVQFHFFGDNDYVAVTGWPNMKQTVSGSGWMGIAPTGQVITMSSLDFWRVENGLIRENWVLLDVIDTYAQIGVDVFARLHEFNKARNLGRIEIPDGMS